jgi:nicotinamide riboside kinase
VKIAFIGTHGVGKTTLCFDLAGTLKRHDLSVDIVKEVARECPLPINKATTLDAQLWILHTQCAREIAACSRFPVVICDRAVIDNYAYLVASAGRRTCLEPMIREWMVSYDLLIKVPIWRPPTFDGLRDTDRTFQKHVDRIVDSLLCEFGLSCLKLDPARRRSWISTIVQRLGVGERPCQLDLFHAEE